MTTKEGPKSSEVFECWQACAVMRRFISELVKEYPKEERFASVGLALLEMTFKSGAQKSSLTEA